MSSESKLKTISENLNFLSGSGRDIANDDINELRKFLFKLDEPDDLTGNNNN